MTTSYTYLIDPRGNGGDPFEVEAADVGSAAEIAARTIHTKIASSIGGQGPYFAVRETGDANGSGMFKVWRRMHGAGDMQSDFGRAFHVMER